MKRPHYIGNEAYHLGYADGAKCTREMLIEEFAQYLDENIEPGLVIYNGGTWCSRDEFIKKMKEAFRK